MHRTVYGQRDWKNANASLVFTVPMAVIHTCALLANPADLRTIEDLRLASSAAQVPAVTAVPAATFEAQPHALS